MNVIRHHIPCSIIISDFMFMYAQVSFCGDPETKKPIQCMATSGHGVWLVAHGSGKVALFHAISHQLLTHVSVTQAVAHKLQSKHKYLIYP